MALIPFKYMQISKFSWAIWNLYGPFAKFDGPKKSLISTLEHNWHEIWIACIWGPAKNKVHFSKTLTVSHKMDPAHPRMNPELCQTDWTQIRPNFLSGLTFCQTWSGFKLFAKIISRSHWQVKSEGDYEYMYASMHLSYPIHVDFNLTTRSSLWTEKCL